ncbi:hypothetical protein ACJ41O_002211 [Fusarium nematophilum]
MPSVREKACEFSFSRHQNTRFPFLNKFPAKRRLLTKVLNFKLNFDTSPKDHRLGCRRSDMPQAKEEQVVVTRNKRSSVSPDSTLSRKFHHRNSTGESRKSRSTKDQEESGQDRQGSPASKSGQANSPAPRRRSQVVEECARLLNVPLPPGGGRQAADSKQLDVKLTAPSAAYLDLDYRINQQLSRRKKVIVDSLMAAITECFEKKLEALEEGCDPCGQGSHPSSSAVQSGKKTSRPAAGQKRQNRHSHRDESENDDDNDDDGFRKKKDSKRAKTTKDDTRKEHLERTHSLPKYQCHRCCRRFKKEEDLKKHQREKTPCPVKEPGSIARDLSEGYDEEQAKRLKMRSRKQPEEKWREWYCILFNLKPDSPDIPSPYHDPSISWGGSSIMKPENIQQCREWLTQATPVIRHHVTLEVERALNDVEPKLRSDVLERLHDLPRRIADCLPFPGLSSEETSDMADTSGFFSFLDDLDADAYADDCFDFQSIDDPALLGVSDSFGLSESSDYSDPYQAGDSSATSLQDDTTYQDFDSKTAIAPESFHLSYSSHGFY